MFGMPQLDGTNICGSWAPFLVGLVFTINVGDDGGGGGGGGGVR